MTPLERILATCEGEKPDKIVWQPRIDHWYDVNRKLGNLPAKYKDKQLLQIYDDLGASPRTYRFYAPTIKVIEGDAVQKKVTIDQEKIVTTYATPLGNLKEIQSRTVHGTTTYWIEHLLKGVQDFQAMTYILQRQSFEFDSQLYKSISETIGDRSEAIIELPHASLQRLTIDFMGFEKTVFSLWKNLKETNDLIRTIEENDSRRIELVKETPFKFVNFADNIDQDLISPPLFEKYLLPWYKRKTRELRDAGKFCTSHWDGNIKLLARYAKETGLDSLECVPPAPMGNITLEELREAMGSMVLFDGIPATHFLDFVSRKELEVFAKKVLRLFSPRLVLGISDQLPPNGDIEKVRMISEIVEKFSP